MPFAVLGKKVNSRVRSAMVVSIALHLCVGLLWYRGNQPVWPVTENSYISANLVSRQTGGVRAVSAISDEVSQPIDNVFPMQAGRPLEIDSQAHGGPSAHDDYMPAERLTRQPMLLGEIDLSAPSLQEGAIEGEIGLVILIESSGLVSEVISGISGTDTAMYVEMLRDRFRKARFLPGEINGQVVRSALKIVVITEQAIVPESSSISGEH